MPLFARLSSKEQHKRLRTAHAPAHRDRHECGRNVADRAGHPLCGRPGHGPHLPLFEDGEGAAAAHRADQPGERRTSVRAVAAVSPTASPSACIRVRISRPAREFTEPEILRTSLGAVVLHMLSVGVARTARGCDGFRFHRSAGYEGRVRWFQRADRAEGHRPQAWRGGADAYRSPAGAHSDRRAFGPYGHRGREVDHAEHAGCSAGGGRVPEPAGSARTSRTRTARRPTASTTGMRTRPATF